MNLVQTLRTEFAQIERIDPSNPSYKKMIALMDRCTDQALVEIKDAGIKFVSSLALNRCIRRGLI
jgi:hypothetical protein